METTEEAPEEDDGTSIPHPPTFARARAGRGPFPTLAAAAVEASSSAWSPRRESAGPAPSSRYRATSQEKLHRHRLSAPPSMGNGSVNKAYEMSEDGHLVETGREAAGEQDGRPEEDDDDDGDDGEEEQAAAEQHQHQPEGQGHRQQKHPQSLDAGDDAEMHDAHFGVGEEPSPSPSPSPPSSPSSPADLKTPFNGVGCDLCAEQSILDPFVLPLAPTSPRRSPGIGTRGDGPSPDTGLSAGWLSPSQPAQAHCNGGFAGRDRASSSPPTQPDRGATGGESPTHFGRGAYVHEDTRILDRRDFLLGSLNLSRNLWKPTPLTDRDPARRKQVLFMGDQLSV